MFPLIDTSSCSPLPSSGSRASQPPVPRSHRYYRFVRLLHTLRAPSMVSLDWRYSSPPRRWREMQRSFPSSWGILVNTCPGLETPVAPLDIALSVQQMLPSAGLTASASTTTNDFGADFLTAHVLAGRVEPWRAHTLGEEWPHPPFRYTVWVPSFALVPRFPGAPCDPGRSDFPSPVLTLACPSQAFPPAAWFKLWHAYALLPMVCLRTSRCFEVQPYPNLCSGVSCDRQAPRVPLPRLGVTGSGAVCATTSKSVTPSSSLVRTHAPDHLPLLCFRRRLIQWVFAGCCQPLLRSGPSRRYLYESFLGCLIHCLGVTCGARARYFPQVIGFPQRRTGQLDTTTRALATSARSAISWLQIFLYVQASKFAYHPGCSYRSGSVSTGQPWCLLPSASRVVAST